jgi:3-dehydroquinate synthase class II
VLNQLGEPIPNAKVTILKGVTELASVQTNDDGKFSFEQLEAGNYDIQVQADSFKSIQSSIVLVKPVTKCKRTLLVTLAVGMSCSSVGLASR